MRNHMIGGLLLVSLAGIAPSMARDAKRDLAAESPAVIKALSECRGIADDARRLTCYDTAASALDTAIATNGLYIMDKASVKKARTSLFGLQLPSLGLFSESADDSNAIVQLDGTVARASPVADGNWRLVLEDKSVWEQTDGQPLGLTPKPGDKVIIKRAALGSYKLTIKGRSGVRVKRLS